MAARPAPGALGIEQAAVAMFSPYHVIFDICASLGIQKWCSSLGSNGYNALFCLQKIAYRGCRHIGVFMLNYADRFEAATIPALFEAARMSAKA
jgi:hypothetical protein